MKRAQTDMVSHILERWLQCLVLLELDQGLFDSLVVTMLFGHVHGANVGHVRDPIHPILAATYDGCRRRD